MLPIAIDYGRAEGGIIPGAVAMAQDLMRGDEATFKRGYSGINALLAASDAFDLSEDQRREVQDLLAESLST